MSGKLPKIMDSDLEKPLAALANPRKTKLKIKDMADYIAKGIKAQLIFRRRENKKDYSIGEIHSCLLLLKKLAIQHRSSDGKGYLKWIRAFFEGRLPITPLENWIYILKNEL